MANISVIGTGYVGLVTGVCLSEIGHNITCIDINEEKVKKMQEGLSPIYEPGLSELMKKNIAEGRLNFTTSYEEGLKLSNVVYIAVGTPQNEDGSADLKYITGAAINIANHLTKDTVVVTKSTVPVGTNDYIKSLLLENLKVQCKVDVVSNPEFLREGSAIADTFNGDRIIIGADNEEAAQVIKEINEPFGIPTFITGVRSAEMIKYASNAFLATKISFINEISNICEKLEADIEEVAYGMGLDKRIGGQFLKAGIGYGGSCFPKDTSALIQIAGNVQHDFELLKAVVNVNNTQQGSLVEKAKTLCGDLSGKKVALLGVAFKPNTDDMREAASIVIAKQLVEEGAQIFAYDPIAVENAKNILPNEVVYCNSINEAIEGADITFIVTEWEEIKNVPLETYEQLMKKAIIFDGRNCYDLDVVKNHKVDYHSVGRTSVTNLSKVPTLNR
ncbi:UDP-glucose dehydrogenase family protein [Bacillus sp. OTU530]|uniref:UDP-glucose dehydrogenase family protein n=1 Tax=Bacillus sp. OTU530 TaxID=3043862 RepID=UPI00313B04B9